jgi:hypothetical protein
LSALQNAGENLQARARAFETLRSYMVYFEGSTFRLLRNDDYEEFASFFNEVNAVKGDSMASPHFSKVLERTAQFNIFLEATQKNIENRSELTDASINIERVDALVRQYI